MFSSLFNFYNKKRQREEPIEKEEPIENSFKTLKLDTQPTEYPIETYKKKVLYRSDHTCVYYNRVKDEFKMVAREFIPKGTLLCIEEAFIGSGPYLINILQHNPWLTKELYPRTPEEYTTPTSLLRYTTSDLLKKINHNGWDWYSEKTDPLSMQSAVGLCPYISKCNHSCTPNAFTLKITNIRNVLDEYTAGFVLYCVEDVKEGEEITISYGDTIGHSPCLKDGYVELKKRTFDWECLCGMSLRERGKLLDNHLKRCRQWWKQDKEIVDHY